jgi:4-methoxybenzoate monooxygenase (O-demethylating)
MGFHSCPENTFNGVTRLNPAEAPPFERGNMSTTSPFAIYDAEPPAGVPVLDIDPFTPEFFADPYPFFDQLRDAGPFVWLSRYNIGAVARYEHVREALMRWADFCSSRGVGMEDFVRHGRFRLPSLILEADPPVHSKARGVLSRVLAPAVLKPLRQNFAKEAAVLVDALLEQRQIDAITDLARTFPLRVFPDAIGMGPEGREKLLPHADMLFNSFGPRNELFQASRDKANFEWIEQQGRREHLTEGGLGQLVHEAVDRGEINDLEATQLVRALLQAGLDTTINSLGAVLYSMTRFPDQWTQLRADPTLVKGAFEEAIRLESPVQTFFRTATKATTLGGTAINEGDKILMFLAAANRDPRQWDRPDQYDIRRRTIGHVGFGAGIHACVGQLLARMEADVLLTELARRVREIRPTGEPIRHFNNTLRSLESLPVELIAA